MATKDEILESIANMTVLELKELLARVLAWDYVGALVIALAFPLALVPSP